MTEPSQEAVELARRLFIAVRGENGLGTGSYHTWIENHAPLLDSALRAVEQRTRLETLERAAKATCDACRDGVALAPNGEHVYQCAGGPGCDTGCPHEYWLSCAAEYIWRLSLEPRARQCVNEGDSCCNHGPEDDAPAEPREAPKAEEPKR